MSLYQTVHKGHARHRLRRRLLRSCAATEEGRSSGRGGGGSGRGSAATAGYRRNGSLLTLLISSSPSPSFVPSPQGGWWLHSLLLLASSATVGAFAYQYTLMTLSTPLPTQGGSALAAIGDSDSELDTLRHRDAPSATRPTWQWSAAVAAASTASGVATFAALTKILRSTSRWRW